MERTKFYKLIIIALVLLNIGVLAFFLLRKPHPGPPKAGDLAKQLGITKDLDQLTALEKAHHVEKRKLIKEGRNLHEELYAKIGSGESTDELRAEIVANFEKTEKMTFDFFDSVATYCTKEQLAELRKTVHRAFNQLHGPPKK